MGATESASRALRALSRHSAIVLAAAAFGLLKVPIEVTGYAHLSYVYWLLALLAFPFTPLLLAVLYGVCDAALERDRRLERATDGGSAHRSVDEPVTRRIPGRAETPGLGDAWRGIRRGYVSLLLANVLYAVVQHLLLFAFAVLWFSAAVLVVLAAAVALELGGGTLAGDVTLGLGGLVLLGVAAAYVLARFGLAFFFQLYRPAAVVGGRGPIEAFAESYRLVRGNLRSAVGFVLVRAFVFVVLLMPGAVALVSFLVVDVAVLEAVVEGEATHLLLAMAVLVYCLGVVQLGFLGTYRVAFYRELVDEGTLPPSPDDGTVTREPSAARLPERDSRTAPDDQWPTVDTGRDPKPGREPDALRRERHSASGVSPDETGRVVEDDPGAPDAPDPVGDPDSADSVGDLDTPDSGGDLDSEDDSGSDPDSETGFVFGQPLEPASNREDEGDERDSGGGNEACDSGSG